MQLFTSPKRQLVFKLRKNYPTVTSKPNWFKQSLCAHFPHTKQQESCHEAWKREKKGVSITDFAVAIWLPSFIIVNWIKLLITFVDRTANSDIRKEHSISKPSCTYSFSNPSFLNLISSRIVHNFGRLHLELSARQPGKFWDLQI